MRSRVLLSVVVVAGLAAAEPPVQPAQPPELPSADEMFEAGKELFDEYAPAEIKAQYDFPSRASWDAFAARLQRALEKDDLAGLAAYEPETKAALAALRVLPGYEDYADWLGVRLDYIEAAKAATKAPVVSRPAPGPKTPVVAIPHYELWLERMRARPLPARASALMPTLQKAFVAEGVPPEIAWLAEAESTLDPGARSPVGARGLFQLMPATAKSLGLSTFLPDERADVEKSARAAARYLRMLHGKFGDWPLAFAAYNAGEGRVRRLLTAHHARTFDDVSAALPSETRMYVPKVCATIAVRAGVTPENLRAPDA